MYQPDGLKCDSPLEWSTGTGTDVWALFCACVAGDLPTVQRLFRKDPSLARCQFQYRKPIYFAVRENRLDIAEFLLEHDPNPVNPVFSDSLTDIARDRGYDAMQRLLQKKLSELHGVSAGGESIADVIRNGDPATVKSLLTSRPELLHAADANGNQPLHWAVMTRRIDVIDDLLSRGADINARRIDGARPIQLTNGDYQFRGWREVPQDHPTTAREVLDHLLSKGADCDLCTAAHIGDHARVTAILNRDPSLANRAGDYVSYYPCSGTPIRNAAAAGHFDIVRLLLDRGADPNLPEEGIAPNGHALYSAAANGHFEIVKLLLERGANPNAAVESSADALSRVISSGDERMLELLCSHGAARSVDLLAYDNDLRTAAAVFDANPQLADDPDALANAAGQGHELFVRLMLRYHPDLPRRVTFPSWLVCAKTRELNELLFRHGMNPNSRDWLEITPLHELAGKGDVDRAAQFLDHGADLQARDDHLCSTPLGWAAKFGQLEMTRFLLQRGAPVNLADDPPWATALAWATRRGHTLVAALLRQHGAR
ncbi:MAG: ankyrin repeat domain-containing protein [Planctomycetaceae bacterium]